MKTQHEIQREARRIEEVVRQSWDEQWRPRTGQQLAPLDQSPSPTAARVLFNFPVTSLTSSRTRDGIEETHTHSTWRWIESGFAEGQPQYSLVEEWAETVPILGTVDRVEAFVDCQSHQVEEILFEGYRQVEEELLAERLGPVLESIDADAWAEGTSAAAEAVELIVESTRLSPAERIRTRLEITEMLEGRMEAVDFIQANIERQYRREAACETLVERPGQRLAIGEP